MSSNENGMGKLPNGTTGYQVTKRDLTILNIRNMTGLQACWNYERMQHVGYLWVMLPLLRKIYGDNTPELRKVAMMHYSSFFNTSSFMDSAVMGIDLAVEEKEGVESIEAVQSLKTGLMGPFASIGDSIYSALMPAICGALAANMAIAGNPLGMFIWIAVSIAFNVFRCKFTHIAHEQGTKLITTMSSQMNALTAAATVMGVFMVGALVATNVGIVFSWVPEVAGVSVNIQDICNTVCPKLLPACMVGFVYWLLGKKGMTSTKAIAIVLVIAIAFGALGIIAKA